MTLYLSVIDWRTDGKTRVHDIHRSLTHRFTVKQVTVMGDGIYDTVADVVCYFSIAKCKSKVKYTDRPIAFCNVHCHTATRTRISRMPYGMVVLPATRQR